MRQRLGASPRPLDFPLARTRQCTTSPVMEADVIFYTTQDANKGKFILYHVVDAIYAVAKWRPMRSVAAILEISPLIAATDAAETTTTRSSAGPTSPTRTSDVELRRSRPPTSASRLSARMLTLSAPPTGPATTTRRRS